MSKKYAYTFKEIAEEVMRKLPGHYKNFDSANATVRAMARELNINDINGKSHNKIVPAVHADIILKNVIERATSRPYTPSTPIEKAVRDAEKFAEPQAVTSEQVDVQEKAEINVEHINNVVRKHTVAFLKSKQVDPMAVEEGKPEPCEYPTAEEPKKVDEFEARRKNFYTDVNYFLKYAQSNDERVAIWGALSKLYGITALPARRIEEAKPETAETSDKWSI